MTTEQERSSILVVDDDPQMVTLLECHLERAGYPVFTATSATDALRIIMRDAPSIVIADWCMPEMDGLELCRAVREHEAIGFTFIIIITAHNQENSVLEAFDAGADDYIAKPCDTKELLARIHAAERILCLQGDLEKRTREVHRFNAEMAIAHDELARANDKLHRLATTDELTGLCNRREALKQLSDHWRAADRNGQPLAAVMIDIDHFKTFNDTWGHAFGDVVLKETARTLLRNSRAGSVVCRVGGEEFLIICPATTAAEASVAADRLREAVAAHEVFCSDERVAVTVSLGVAQRAEDMNKPDDLVSRADEALYHAKRTGRNRVCIADQEEDTPTIPSAPDTADEVPALEALPVPNNEDISILLVEAIAEANDHYTGILTRDGFEVRSSSDGVDALAMVKDLHPDILIANTELPTLPGLELARAIKADPTIQHMPVILYGSGNTARDICRCLQTGAEQYLPKPIQPAELSLRVRSMARQAAARKTLARINDLRSEQTRAMILLLDFSRHVAGNQTLDAILERTVVVAAELTCAHRVSILLPDRDRRYLRVAHSIGIDQKVATSVRVPVGTGITGTVFEANESMLLNESSEFTRRVTRYETDLFASVPLVTTPLNASDEILGVINITNRYGDVPITNTDLEYIELLSNIAAWAIHDIINREARDEARDSIVVALAKLAEFRDNDTGRHLDRVTRYCTLLAEDLRSHPRCRRQIDDGFICDLERAVPLHDIGKVAIPDHILLKPMGLTDAERTIMQNHAQIGADTIRSIMDRVSGTPFLRMAEQIAHGHHEWYNGQGYPRGLAGESIPLAARITAVADVYDALTTPRIYKEAMPHAQAVSIIKDGCGKQFDPIVIESFLKHEQDIYVLSQELADDRPEVTNEAVRPQISSELGTPPPTSELITTR
jgi:diguanylate cyclase (GGDEF)-like protein